MQRYNVFFPVHKGLRALLLETSLQLQQTSFTVPHQADEALEKIKSVIDLFESHAHKEDTYVFPAIASYEPSVIAAFEQEHVEDHALGESLQAWITAFEYAVNTSAKKQLGNELLNAFLKFTAFNLRHMAKEEDIINKLLWRYYSDAELHELTQKIVGSIPPAEMIVFSRWMVRGLNNEELVAWLQAIINSAPEHVSAGMLALAEAELPRQRWEAIEDSLNIGVLMA